MNRIWTILMALTLTGLWTFAVLPGCRTIATPTFPSTYTPVPSATATFTKTNTPTFTLTFTSTFSPTVGSPTNTPTASFTATPTNTVGAATSTPTPTATCTTTTTPALIDDMEDNDNQVIVQQCRNGYWYAYNDGTVGGIQSTGGTGVPLPPAATQTAQPTATPEPFTLSSTGAGAACSGSSSHAIEVATNNGFTGYGDGFGFNFTQPQGPYDASGYTGIQFCAMNSLGNLTVSFAVPDANSVATNYASGPHAVNVNLTSSWQTFQVTMATLVSSSNTYGSPTVFQPSQIEAIQWVLGTTVASDIWIDNLTFY